MKNKKSENSSLRYLIGLLFLILGFSLVFIPTSKPVKKSNNQQAEGSIEEQSLKKVNDHLWKSQLKNEIEMQIAKEKIKSEALNKNSNRSQFGSAGDTSSPWNKNEDFTREIERESNRFGIATDPSEVIHSKIFEDDKFDKYNEEYKQEYARQFIENARKNGWIVELDEKYQVKSVRPTRKPSQQNQLFNSGHGGSQ